MRVIYQGIDMMSIETHEYLWQAIYDDTMTDYLYTEVSGQFTSLVSGETATATGNGPFMSYDFVDSGPGAIGSVGSTISVADDFSAARPTPNFALPGDPTIIPANTGITKGIATTIPRQIRFTPTRPLRSQEVVRHRLETQQGKLYVFGDSSGLESETVASIQGNGVINLISPLDGAVVDCKNGPFAKLFNVSQVMSQDNLLVVDWGFVTYINEAKKNRVSPSGALLSNRFTQRHSVTSDGWTTIQTVGLALFRTDLIYSQNKSPDANRATLFLPIPRGFERTIDYVEGRADVTGIEYGYTDSQVPVNFVAGPYAKAAKIAAVHRQAVTSNADILTGALSLYDRAQSVILNNKWIREVNEREEDKQTKKNRKKKNKAKLKFPPSTGTP